MLAGIRDIDEMPAGEYLSWMRYDAQEPIINGYMLDTLFAHLMYVIAAANGCKNVSLDTFRTFTAPPKKTKAQILSALKRLGLKKRDKSDGTKT